MLLRLNIYFTKKRPGEMMDWFAYQENFQLLASPRYVYWIWISAFVNYATQLWHKISSTNDVVPSYIPFYLQVLPSTDAKFLVSNERHKH